MADRSTNPIPRWAGAALGTAVAGYTALAAIAWWRYGRPPRPGPDDVDSALDRFMPAYDIVERHRVRVAAPADVTLAAARDMSFDDSALVNAIFRTRALVMRARREDEPRPRGLEAQVRALGWGVIAETPGREIVFGAVTRPWMADPEFRAVPPDEFATFSEPDYVRIAWTLRADPVGEDGSMFRTETRAGATDDGSRRKFRRYWSLVSPGVWTIRRLMLRPVKAEAERRWRAQAAALTASR